jgi:O-antigen/teichoic acid export membrane protein
MVDKSLPLVFGLAFLVLVVRVLPETEFALQVIAGGVLLTLSQIFRSLFLVPLARGVAERGGAGRVAATGTLLYVGASSAAALALGAGRHLWAAVFDKPGLDAVLIPSAWLLAGGSGRDAAVACLEGLRRLRAVCLLDAVYYGAAIGALAAWSVAAGPRTATAVQWIQAGAATFGMLVAVAYARRELFVAPARSEARKILRFGSSFLSSGVAATLSQQADTLLAGRLMDAPGVAAYGAARQLFRVFNVLAQALNQVLMPVAARLHATDRRHDLRVLFEKSVCFLALVLVPGCLLLALATGPLFDLFFGGRYRDAVRPFQILVVGALVSLPLASVASPLLIGMGRLRTLAWITWAGLGLAIALVFAWTPAHGPQGVAAAVAVAAVFGMLVRAWVLRPLLGYSLGGIWSRRRDALAFARERLAVAASTGRNDQNVQ